MIKIYCPKCMKKYSRSGKADSRIVKDGSFWRSSDRKRVQRYYCRDCNRRFSSASFSVCFLQKKRHLNTAVGNLLCSAVSMRQSARLLRLDRKTIARKLVFLGSLAKLELKEFNDQLPPARMVQYDDMETYEHTKCKPLSIGVLIEDKVRRVLGVSVASAPAKGKLAAISRRKYGERDDQRPDKRIELFEFSKNYVHPNAVFMTDEWSSYPNAIKKIFPSARHIQFKGRTSSYTGQGELKEGGFDPLFSVNHTAATLRAKISRLIRKTWCLTKRPDRLELHLALVCLHHNQNLRL